MTIIEHEQTDADAGTDDEPIHLICCEVGRNPNAISLCGVHLDLTETEMLTGDHPTDCPLCHLAREHTHCPRYGQCPNVDDEVAA